MASLSTLSGAPFYGRLWPYPQILDEVGKAGQGQMFKLITKICKLSP